MSLITSLPTTTTNATGAPTTQTQAEQARTVLSGNFDTFLKLLTTQLQNQDPLEPMDSSKFTEQLVQYSQVEQQIQTNSQLSQLNSTLTTQIQATSAGAALAYIGKTATFDSDAMKSTGAGAEWNYILASTTAATTISIADDRGNIVYSAPGSQQAGAHVFAWDGKTNGGDSAPPGIYHMTISATDTQNKRVDALVNVTELINGIDLSSATDAAVTTASGARAFTSILKITG